MPETWGVQVVPTLVVFKIVPLKPTAKQVVTEVHAMLFIGIGVVWLVQVAPPLVVVKSTVKPPIKQVVIETQAILERLLLTPEARGVQLVPPLVVLIIVPLPPTTKQEVADRQAIL